jgi:hypothetical protein
MIHDKSWLAYCRCLTKSEWRLAVGVPTEYKICTLWAYHPQNLSANGKHGAGEMFQTLLTSKKQGKCACGTLLALFIQPN